MIARTRVEPPLTPRIVQMRPRERLLRYALLATALLAALWVSYHYGRSRAPAGAELPAAATIETESGIAALEQARDDLQQQVVALERSLQREQRALAEARARIDALEQARSASPIAATTPPAETRSIAAPAAPAVEPGLHLEQIRITEGASENAYRLGFSVTRGGAGDDRVIGTIWIAVNGFVDGRPTRLSLKAVSPDARAYVKMGFERQQDVLEEILLPETFTPKNVMIEVKPFGDRHKGTAVKHDWAIGG